MTSAALAKRGHCLIRPGPGLDADSAARDPWAAAEQLFGESVALVEHQPIAPVPGGRSFASNDEATPLHTDSQLHRGVPPHVQLMFCARAARDGGQSLLLDTHRLLERIEVCAPKLFESLLTTPRRIPFVFGDVHGPTVSLRGGSLVFTHSPQPANDPIGHELGRILAAETPLRVRVADGELLVVDNHRMLHGREAFSDPMRRFTRLLVWLRRGIASHPRFESLARAVPPSEPLGVGGMTERERVIVRDMLRGVPPGVLSRRHGVAEPTLYAWRDRVLAAMGVALARR